jgi:hypothetical protein
MVITLRLVRSIVPEGGVERGRLARAGRAGDQDDARGAIDQVHELGLHLLGHADLVERELRGRLIEQAENEALAVDRGDAREADVDLAAADADAGVAVLGAVAVGDVELGHDLQSRADGGRERERRAERVDQHAVDAEADDELVLHRVDVDVAGATAEGLEEDHVDEADDGRLARELEEVGGLADRAREVLIERSSSGISSTISVTRSWRCS